MFTDWSYKKIKMYRACPFSVKLKYIDRVPEPPQDPKYDHKRLRGIKAHDDLEAAVNVGGPVPEEFADFAPIVASYVELGGKAESDEYFDSCWNPMTPELVNGWPKGHWLVVKKDVRVLTPSYSLVVDWKTGKKHGNELDHFEQMKLYAVTEWRLYPGLPEYSVELQYLDQKDTWMHKFTPRDLERHWAHFDKDVDVMFNDKLFRPKPNILTCRYCPYNHKNGTGACPVAAV